MLLLSACLEYYTINAGRFNGHITHVCSYPYGGNVPLNLARLHASVAHYCPQQDDYQVKVLCVSDLQEAAQLVRTISEDTRKQSEVYSPSCVYSVM